VAINGMAIGVSAAIVRAGPSIAAGLGWRQPAPSSALEWGSPRRRPTTAAADCHSVRRETVAGRREPQWLYLAANGCKTYLNLNLNLWAHT
jgi:hypothetical protein